MHNKRPSPRQVRQLVVEFTFVFFTIRLLPPESLEESSHRFSPRRKTLARGTPASVVLSSVSTSFISVEATGAPLAPYEKKVAETGSDFVSIFHFIAEKKV